MSIQVENLSKSYGTARAVNDISFEVHSGEVLGFLGPNGAGKTTTMRIITGYLASSGGSIKVEGRDVLTESFEVRKLIGYLPEANPLYHDMNVLEYLEYAAQLQGSIIPRYCFSMNRRVVSTRIRLSKSEVLLKNSDEKRRLFYQRIFFRKFRRRVHALSLSTGERLLPMETLKLFNEVLPAEKKLKWKLMCRTDNRSRRSPCKSKPFRPLNRLC